MFKNHLDMIGRNEPVSKKAKFWQSYVRSLKGSDDIRAGDVKHHSPRGLFRGLSDFPELHSTTWPYGKSIFDDPIHAAERISVPGYRYNPIHRETYGYTPRNIYPHQYSSMDRFRPVYHIPAFEKRPFDADKAWQDHLDRIAKTEYEFPGTYPFSRYPLYLVYHRHPHLHREKSPSVDPHRLAWLDHINRMNEMDKLFPSYPRSLSPTPIKAGEWGPRPSEVAFNYAGMPIYTRGGVRDYARVLNDLLNPSPYLPHSAIIREPWWWKVPSLRPLTPPYDDFGKSPFYLRDSYLSPVKRTYLWDKHPIRPFEDPKQHLTAVY